jgi:hypothetical protein
VTAGLRPGDANGTPLPPKIEREKDTDAGRLHWLIVHWWRDIDGLRVGIGPPIFRPIPITIALAIAMLVTLTLVAMPSTLSMPVIFISERRRYRQTAYQ